MDFEEITYDKTTGEVYLSVEGNGENFNDYVGIYKLILKTIMFLLKMLFLSSEYFINLKIYFTNTQAGISVMKVLLWITIIFI